MSGQQIFWNYITASHSQLIWRARLFMYYRSPAGSYFLPNFTNEDTFSLRFSFVNGHFRFAALQQQFLCTSLVHNDVQLIVWTAKGRWSLDKGNKYLIKEITCTVHAGDTSKCESQQFRLFSPCHPTGPLCFAAARCQQDLTWDLKWKDSQHGEGEHSPQRAGGNQEDSNSFSVIIWTGIGLQGHSGQARIMLFANHLPFFSFPYFKKYSIDSTFLGWPGI